MGPKHKRIGRLIRRARRSALAIGLVLYAHAWLAAGVWLVLQGGNAALAGAALLAALLTTLVLSAGLVMGNRLYRHESPIPPVAELDSQLSGASPDMADEIQEMLDQMQEDEQGYQHASFSLTAPETR